MREIKFRAWTGVSMLEPVTIKNLLNNYNSEYGNSMAGWDRNNYDFHGGIDFVVMQFTGLKDKNGKEIYEGDIIQDEEGDIFLVFWNEKQAQFKCDLIGEKGVGIYDEFSIEDTAGEIVGNLYENPELLTQLT